MGFFNNTGIDQEIAKGITREKLKDLFDFMDNKKKSGLTVPRYHISIYAYLSGAPTVYDDSRSFDFVYNIEYYKDKIVEYVNKYRMRDDFDHARILVDICDTGSYDGYASLGYDFDSVFKNFFIYRESK